MSKRKAHMNIRKRGGSDQFEPIKKKPNARLRPIVIPARKPDYFYLVIVAWAVLCLAAAFVFK